MCKFKTTYFFLFVVNGQNEIEPLTDNHEIHNLQEQGVYKFWFSACDFIGDQFKLCQAGDLSKIIYFDCVDPRDW